jgi:FdhD protein
MAITMRTPGADYELAAGFLYSEGVINHKDAVHQITYCRGDDPNQQEYNQLRVQLRSRKLPDLPRLERHFIINSACGLCGKASLDALAEQHPNRPLPVGPTISHDLLYGLPDTLRVAQTLFENTGGLHAAALFDTSGQLLALREDVGRHNALDKLIGWALLNNKLPFHDRLIMVSGRASYELLQKCLAAGAPIFCAISAPSSLAVSLAQQFGITLVGFLRGNRYNVYSGLERIRNGTSP